MKSFRQLVMPLSPHVHRAVFAASYRLMRMLHSKHSRADWDDQFKDGRWDFLLGKTQIPRQSVIAGYCDHYAQGGAILEIGCGNGGLVRRLGGVNYSRYLGLDISAEAIATACAAGQNQKNEFVCVDAAAFQPTANYDVIAFNECLTYFDDPIDILCRYQESLTERGVLLVSMFETLEAKSIWQSIAPSCEVKDSIVLIQPDDQAWHRVKVFRMNGGPRKR